MSDVDARRVIAEVGAYYDASIPPALYDPHISSLTPATVSAAAGATTVTVRGTNFVDTSVVEVQQVAQPTTFVDDSTLTISYDPTVGGTVLFTVRNAVQESNSVPFVVTALAEGETAVEQSDTSDE